MKRVLLESRVSGASSSLNRRRNLQDVGWREHICLCVPMDEPCQHAQCWDKGDDLQETPEGEKETRQHLVELSDEHGFSWLKVFFCNKKIICDSSDTREIRPKWRA